MPLVYKNTSCEEDSFVNFWIFKKFLDLLLAFFLLIYLYFTNAVIESLKKYEY